MHDFAHQKTDKVLAELEERIFYVYSEAEKELRDTVTTYFQSFAQRDKKQQQLCAEGKITKQEYQLWRLNQIGRGNRFKFLQDEMAERYTNANEIAISYVNDATPGVYSLNRNYAAYTIEQVAGNVGFTLWDEQTVKGLIAEQPDLMPNYPAEKAVKRGIDLAYGKKQITASVTSGILQGKSIDRIANDLQKRLVNINQAGAVRAARTAVTEAQNAGRMDSYAAAQEIGIKLQKEWVAALDGRTRHSHAMLDGEQVDNDKKFSNGCMFPGDPNGPPWEVYNCRCTLIAAVDGVDTSDAQRRARDPETGESILIENMSYAEWAGWKKAEGAGTKNFKKAQVQKAMDEKQEPQRNPVNGKDLVGDIDYKNSKFDYDIEAALNAQGFDGLPRVVSNEQFEEALKKSNFYAERTYCAPTQEVLDEYRNQLYNGKWYVDCSEGGAQYGQGMYCAARFENGKYIIPNDNKIGWEMSHYQEIGISKGNKFSYTEGITLTPDAKIFTLYEDDTDIINRYAREYALKKASSEDMRSVIREMIDIQEKIDRSSNSNFVGKVDWDFVDKLYDERARIYDTNKYKDEINKLINEGFSKAKANPGALAAEMGYDAINAQGHGESGSYTVILNRTKCIFREGGSRYGN